MVQVRHTGAGGLALVFALLTCAASASADRAADVARADTLFRQARKLMDDGDFAKACPLLEDSQRLDPGLGTQLNIALCYKGLGRLVTAAERYGEAAAKAESAGDKRAEFARAEQAKLEARLPRLLLHAPPDAPAGLEVWLDGVPLNPSRLEVAFTNDPGAIHIEARAPGRPGFKTDVVLAEGATTTVELDVGPASFDGKAAGQGARRGRSRRLLAYGVGGVGLALVGVGTVFGLLARSRWSDAQDGCDGGFCTPAGQDKADSARSAATVSTITFVAGGAALAAGVVLYLTAPKGREQPRAALLPALGPDRAGVVLTGRF